MNHDCFWPAIHAEDMQFHQEKKKNYTQNMFKIEFSEVH